MRKILPSHPLAILAAVALVLVGCATPWQATISLTAVMDAAMKDWAQMSAAGRTTPDIDARVVKLHDQYRLACAETQAALIAYQNTGDQTDYVAGLQLVRESIDKVFDLILPYMTPAKGAQYRTQANKATSL